MSVEPAGRYSHTTCRIMGSPLDALTPLQGSHPCMNSVVRSLTAYAIHAAV